MADYPDWTAAIELLGSEIQVPIDVQGAYIQMPIDIQGQYITLDINIAASAITLNVAIASSAVTLNVNISSTTAALSVNLTASAITLNISVTAQTIAVRNQGEYSAVAGQGVEKTVSFTNVTFGNAGTATYTVTAGKTLYITDVSFAIWANAAASGDLNQMGDVAILVGSTVYFIMGGNGGGMVVLPRPLIFAAGTVVILGVDVRANHACNGFAQFHGYEL